MTPSPIAPEHNQLSEVWPPDRFYWSVLDGPDWKLPRGRSMQAPAGLLAEVADDLPVSIESLHAVAAPLADGRTIVIAVERELLDREAGSLDQLVPASLPPFLQTTPSDEGPSSLSGLNLLTGDFEPRSARRARTLRHVQAALFFLFLCTLVALGLHRRAAHHDQIAASAAAAHRAVLALPLTSGPLVSLDQELTLRRRVSAAAPNIAPPADAALALTALLSSWPAQSSAKPQSASITAREIDLAVVIQGDSASFLKAVKPPAGWSLEEPRLNTSGDFTRASLRLLATKPSPSAGAAPSPRPIGPGAAP